MNVTLHRKKVFHKMFETIRPEKLLHIVLCVAATIPILFTSKCSTPLSGNASETTNRVAVVISSEGINGNAPPFSAVYLIKNDFIPCVRLIIDSGAVDTFTTGADGNFFFKHLAQKTYNLLCSDTLGNKSLLTIPLDTLLSNNDTLYDTLYPGGTIAGSYRNYTPSDTITRYIYLPGTLYYTALTKTGDFSISGIPAGIIVINWVDMLRNGIKGLSYVKKGENRDVAVHSDSITIIELEE